MIVSCRSCQTRFRIADEKIKERGVKVRCSRCGEVFLVRRDEELTQGPGDLPWRRPEPAPNLPAGDEVSLHDQPTRVGRAPAGLLGVGAPAPGSPAPDSLPAHDPFAALDPFGDGLPSPPPPPPSRPPPPAAASSLDDDPFAALDLDAPPRTGPPPLPTSPAPPRTSPSLAPPMPADDDPFAGLESAQPQAAPADPFGLAEFASDLSSPGRSLDLGGGAAAPPPSSRPAEAHPPPAPSTDGRRPVARLAAPSGPIAQPGRRRQGGAGAVLSLLLGLVILLGGLAGLVASRTGGLDPARLDLDTVFRALGLDVGRAAGAAGSLVPLDLVTSLYPTASGQHVLVVRGKLESRASAPAGPAVRVQAELLGDGERVMAEAWSWAGAIPSLEQLHALRGESDWEDLSRALAAQASAVAPGSTAPFLVVFGAPPQRLERARIRLTAEAAVPTPPPEPALPPLAADPAPPPAAGGTAAGP